MGPLTDSLRLLFNKRERALRRATRLIEKEHFYTALTAYRQAAESGSVEAMLALARMHERGQGTPISFPHALEWYQAAAREGEVEGHFGAGSCLMRMERIPRGVRSWYQNIADDEPERAAELGALLGTRLDLEDPYVLAREHLIEACQHGHGEAHYRLAELFVRGLGGERDPKQAHDLYIIAAASGIAGAEYGLGELYSQGEGCDANSDTALIWYKRAAGHGHLAAQLMVAQHLMARATPEDLKEARLCLMPASEHGAPHADFLLASLDLSPSSDEYDEERGKTHLRRAAAKGHLHAMKRMAQIYEQGLLGETRNETEAAAWYKKAAEAGDVEAQFVIGRMYARGEGVPQIVSSAARWFAKSAEGGHALAQFNYAILLERGDGIPADPQAARGILLQAAEQGFTPAQFKLGRDLLQEPDTQAAGLSWLEKAAAHEHVAASAVLGQLYANGQYVTREPKRAIAYLQRAAASGHGASYLQLAHVLRTEGAPMQDVFDVLMAATEIGSPEAEFALAQIHLAGEGRDADVPTGVAWLEKAALHGLPQALFDLGVRYCRGEGTAQDIVRGMQLYKQAGEAGHLIGKFNYATLVLGDHGLDGDRELARRFLREAARAGLPAAQEACQRAQISYEADADNVEEALDRIDSLPVERGGSIGQPDLN